MPILALTHVPGPCSRAAVTEVFRMNLRQHVPFDTFAMKVDVPVSMFVRDGGVGWSCGQCPLDHQSQVLAPHDPVTQAAHVCDMIQHTLARANFAIGEIAKLHVYFVPTSPDVDTDVLGLFRARFSLPALIVPIAVPHFYYDGMMIEVDVFAGRALEATPVSMVSDVSIDVVEGPELIWATARHAVSTSDAAPESCRAIGTALSDHGLASAHLLSDHWFVPGASLDPSLDWGRDFVTMPNAIVAIPDHATSHVCGTFVFSRDPVDHRVFEIPDTPVTVVQRRAGRFIWCAATCRDEALGLAAQTAPLMEGIKFALSGVGMTFRDVTKLTAHYVGGATEDDLHNNMQIRHSYYGTPGPASTGLPVHALAGPSCKLSVDVFGVATEDLD